MGALLVLVESQSVLLVLVKSQWVLLVLVKSQSVLLVLVKSQSVLLVLVKSQSVLLVLVTGVGPAGPGQVAVGPAGPGQVAVGPGGPGRVRVGPAGPGQVAVGGLVVLRRASMSGTLFHPVSAREDSLETIFKVFFESGSVISSDHRIPGCPIRIAGNTYGGVIKSIHFFSQLTVQTRSLFLLVFLVGAAVSFALRYRAKDGRVSVTYGTASKRIAKLYGIDRHKTVERNKILLTIKQLEKQAELRRLLTEAATERLRCGKGNHSFNNEVIRNLTNFIPEEREVSRDHPNLEKSRFNLEYMKMNQLYELAEYDRILSLKRTELIRNEPGDYIEY